MAVTVETKFLDDRTAIHSTIRILSSVCLSVTLCIAALGVGVQGSKLYQRVPSRQICFMSLTTVLTLQSEFAL